MSILKTTWYTIAICLLASCGTPAENRDNKSRSRTLYDEGMELTSERIDLPDDDSIRKRELNKSAIEKFEASYKADTTNRDAVLFASECTMYGKEYKNCIYWTIRLIQLDTSERNRNFCLDRIAYCTQQLNSSIN
jgi:hypothetical protein